MDSSLNKIIKFLDSEPLESFPLCRKYLESNKEILIKWFEINMNQGSELISDWVAWTELSLKEIENYNN